MSSGPFGAILSDSLIFAGHALALFLLSMRKYSFRRSALIWTGVFLLSTLFSIIALAGFSLDSSVLNQSVSLALCAVAFLVTSKGSILRNLFLFASYLNFLLYALAIAQALASEFFNNDPLAVTEFRLILIVIFCVILVYDIRPAFLRVSEKLLRGWGSLTVLVCVFCGCLLVTAIMSNLFVEVSLQIIAMLVVLFVIMISAYIVIFKLIAALSDESRKRQLEMETKFLTNQLTVYEQMERENRKYRHDFRHHNLLILEYARNRDCDAIIRYLQEYESDAERKLGSRVCENMTVNSIVSAFIRRASEQNIRFTRDIRMRKETSVRDTDLVAILANVLENAVKGCLLSENGRWIDLTIVHRGQKLIIQCRNSCAENIRFLDGLPQATGRTGIGITSIVDAAAGYAGNTEFSAEKGIFTSRILLNDGEAFAN